MTIVLGTGEQWPQGESINARLFGVALERGQCDLAALTQGQTAAAQGLLARCMADCIHDLARDLENIGDRLKAQWQDYRQAALQKGLNGRAPEQIAFLMIGVTLAFGHFKRCGLTVPNLPVADLLMELTQRHARHVLDAQPAERFRTALMELLTSEQAHLQPLQRDGGHEHGEPILRGPRIGWQRDDEIYLLPSVALELVNETLRKGDAPLNIRPRALWRQCQQRGWILAGNATKTGNESSRTVWINGKSERVLVFKAKSLQDEIT